MVHYVGMSEVYGVQHLLPLRSLYMSLIKSFHFYFCPRFCIKGSLVKIEINVNYKHFKKLLDYSS